MIRIGRSLLLIHLLVYRIMGAFLFIDVLANRIMAPLLPINLFDYGFLHVDVFV